MYYWISVANASTTSEHANYFISETITGWGDTFWSPFGAWAVFALTIGIAIMIWRRIRGTGRKPG